MISQKDVAVAFGKGELFGKASNFEIECFEHKGNMWTMLVGYGHACYALRSPEGHITFFSGWRGYSATTTSKHLPAVRYAQHEAKSWFEDTRRAKTGEVRTNPVLWTVVGKVIGA